MAWVAQPSPLLNASDVSAKGATLRIKRGLTYKRVVGCNDRVVRVANAID